MVIEVNESEEKICFIGTDAKLLMVALTSVELAIDSHDIRLIVPGVDKFIRGANEKIRG